MPWNMKTTGFDNKAVILEEPHYSTSQCAQAALVLQLAMGTSKKKGSTRAKRQKKSVQKTAVNTHLFGISQAQKGKVKKGLAIA